MEMIERGIADISKILEENLFQIQNDYRESINKESDKEVKEREEVKEGVEEVDGKEEKKESENEKHEKNRLNFRPTTTLVPSSNLVCVVNCWNSSNIFQSPNISSLCHEGNKVNEEIFSQQVEGSYEIRNEDYLLESKGDEKQTNSSNKSEVLYKFKVTCDGFNIFVFDPGGIQAINSRSNSLEEGLYNVILRCYPLTRIIKSLWNKRTKLFLVQIAIFVGYYVFVLYSSYLELCNSD